MRKLIAAPLLAFCVAAAAACGSDSDSKDPAPTKSEYIASADKICKETIADFETDAEGLDPDADFEKLQSLTVEVLRDQVKQLRDLTPPEGDEATIDEMLDEVEKGADTIESWQGPEDASNPLTKADELATSYGLAECGSA